ncbi:MAG: MFS transporter [Herbiconiux sp.]|uniref:MFS transporter n=1 Tax=Herbiconiux sp. TaxID=1871186 RepID=UPI001210E923|nr:MFS transporter [Herbiconiux sp.]TAJ49108.1 MAG: MFS transporter [Herbiconiux sp.]
MAQAPHLAVGRSFSAEEITARLDRIPALTRKHIVLIVLLISVFTFDIIDLASFSYVAPGLIADWGVSVEQIGLLTSTAFIGMFLGGVIGGRLADRFGRRPLVLVGVVIFSLASLASALAPTPEILGGLRLFTGFGLQMATGAILVTVSETFPKPFRGRVMALVLGVSLIGGPIIALVGRIFVPLGMWHVVFIVGGLGLIPAAFALKYLPESPRWLAIKGRGDLADAQLRIYESQYEAKRGPLPGLQIAPAAAAGKKSSILDIFRRNLIARTIVATLAFCCLILLNYGFASWLPTILIERGYPQTDALTFSFILSFATMAGALVALLFIDRIERKVSIALAVVLMAVSYLTIGFVDSVPVLLIAGFLANMLSQVVSATMYAYVPEMFPVSVRGVGAGFANGVGRVAGIFSGIILAAVIAAFAVQGVFVYLAIVAVVMGVIVLFGPVIGIRTAHLKLKAEKAEVQSLAAAPAGN